MSVTREILQNHDEWLQHRTRIGGSDAAAIVGMNPYMTNVDLWEIKTGKRQQEDISSKLYVQYGINAEPLLRSLYQLDHPQYELSYVKNNLWTNDRYPFAHASLDGWLKDKDSRAGVWECKTTNILQSMQREKWKNRIPDNYYIQVIHYLMITEFDFAELKAQLRSEFGGTVYLQTKHYHIERSEVQDDIEYLAAKEAEFWEYVKKDERPPLMLPAI